MFGFKKSLLIIIVLFALSNIEARADSFVIGNVGGTLFVSASLDAGPPTLKLPPTFFLFGPGFSVYTDNPNRSGDVGNVQARDICQSTVCVPGTVIGTNSSFSGIFAPSFSASAVINGVRYDVVSPLTGTLNFASRPIVLSNFDGFGRATVPFSFTGQLAGELIPRGGRPEEVTTFTATLSGQGLATFRFVHFPPNQNPRLMLDGIDYQFQTPEPATVLLLLSGLTGLGVVARRKFKRPSQSSDGRDEYIQHSPCK